jgi:2-haloacid dehalogenase
MTAVVFDLGGVLIDWNPRYLYRKLFEGDEAATERFLSTVCTQEWNEKQDAGRPFAEGEAELIAKYPADADLIRAWRLRFNETMKSEILGTVAILAELRQQNMPLYALTNWSDETFQVALKRFDFLGWFKGIVESGLEKLIKPDPRLYRVLLDRYHLDAAATVFIDDRQVNVDAAAKLGFKAIHFTTPEALRAELNRYNLLLSQRCAS